MRVYFDAHARHRLAERGATLEEAERAVREGAAKQANFGRTAFMLYFPGTHIWRDVRYAGRELEVIAAPTGDGWLIITAIVRFVR